LVTGHRGQLFRARWMWRNANRAESHGSRQAREQAPTDLRRARRTARRAPDRREPERLARSPGVGGCDSATPGRAWATAVSSRISARGSRLRHGGDSARSGEAAYRAVGCYASYRAWEWVGPVAVGSWSGRLPGSTSSDACASATTGGPTSTRRSGRSGARSFVGSRGARRG
jgi:hypothetical protein